LSRSVDLTLRAAPGTVELGRRRAHTWLLNGALPGPTVRVRRSGRVRVTVENGLPEGTSIHWHGIRLKNAMDGVPDVTQPEIAPGDRFVYEFEPPDAGTFFYHSHSGLQLDTGIQGPLIVDDPDERVEYDDEAFLQLDDWLDGVDGLTPQAEMAQLEADALDNPMMMPATTPPSLMSSGWPGAVVTGTFDKGDVQDYPLFLITGRPPESPHVVTAGAGRRVRLRIVNAGADATFAFFVEGQEMTVTHADAVPVRRVRTEAVVLGPGERYDAIVAVPEGVTRVIAAPMGKKGVAMAVLRSTGAKVRSGFEREPYAVPTRVLPYRDLQSLEGPLLDGTPRSIRLDLGKVEGEYKWLIQGQAYPDADPVAVEAGEYVRFVIRNGTGMIHPMHLHGHFFRLGGPDGPVKDTFLPPPTRVSTIDWIADNPGRWAFHCHNEYHLPGMFRVVEVS